MASVELTKDEIDLVVEVLEGAYRDLREEVYKTEEHHYKEQLKQREARLEALLGKFSAAARTAG
jgi:FtsZ-binding cell division protein ZapB